jgi:hypothetical protein
MIHSFHTFEALDASETPKEFNTAAEALFAATKDTSLNRKNRYLAINKGRDGKFTYTDVRSRSNPYWATDSFAYIATTIKTLKDAEKCVKLCAHPE